MWMDYFTYCTIGIRLEQLSNDGYDNRDEGGGTLRRVIRFCPPAGNSGSMIEHTLTLSNSDVILRVECGSLYRFGFREIIDKREVDNDNEDDTLWVGKVANDVMTRPPPIGAQFTGIMLGLYAFGEYRPCSAPADFHYVNVTNYG